MLLHEIAKVPKGKPLAETRELAGIYGERTRQGVEVHRANDARELLLAHNAEFREHLRHEL